MHPRYRTPGRAIVLQAVWAAVLVLTGTYRELFTRVIYTEWIFFALLAVGVVLLRRRPATGRNGECPVFRSSLSCLLSSRWRFQPWFGVGSFGAPHAAMLWDEATVGES